MIQQAEQQTGSLVALSQTDGDEAEYVTRLAEMMSATTTAAAHWIVMSDGDQSRVVSDHEEDLADFQLLISRFANFRAARDQAIATRRVTSLVVQAEEQAANRFDFDPLLDTTGRLFLVPLQCTVDAQVVICLYHDSTQTQESTDSIARHLSTLATIGYLRTEVVRGREQHDAAQEQNRELTDALQLTESVGMSLDKEQSAYVLADRLQSYLGADRVTILDKTGKRYRILSVSGQASFNPRANVVRRTQQMAKTVLRSGEALWFTGDTEGLSETVRQSVRQYVDESMVQSFALVPIFEQTEPHFRSDEEMLIETVNPGRTGQRRIRGAILIENISTPLEEAVVAPRLEHVSAGVMHQFNNAKKHSDLFLLPTMSTLTKLAAFYRGHTARIAWTMTLAIIGLITAGLVVPADFLVRCEGYLQPEQMHHVFVRKDGIVQEVKVRDGQQVKQGDVLAVLQNRELELEVAQLTGELEELEHQRHHLIYQRLDYQNNTRAQQSDQNYHDLSERTALVDSQIRTTQKTLELKRRQQEDLIVRAPFDGQVMGWNVDRRYLHRPLEQGTRLFSVADENRDRRILELKVPDQRSGYVAQAWRDTSAQEERLPVQFTLASMPNQRFEATIQHVNPGLEQDSDLGYVLPVEASPVSNLPDHLRAGVPVMAKVNCGRRSFLYCRTYEFVDYLRRAAFEHLL